MPLARRSTRHVEYWPSFVDALSTMLLVIIFLLSVFMLSQFFLSREVTSKDTALTKLESQVAELTQLLSLERAGRAKAETDLGSLRATLGAAQKEEARLKGAAAAAAAGLAGAGGAAAKAGAALDSQKALTAQALAQVDVLNQQIAALRRQLAAIEDALSASEAADKRSQARIADLGARLNVALAQKVQQLARYRSDFFGRLREILGDRPGIRIVGDRFVFSSELLFAVGKADLSDAGKSALDKLAPSLLELAQIIPPEIPWILRVDGHTDKAPISAQSPFGSNWGLSAARAIAVVRYLKSKGVPPDRLAAAGFGEFQPLDPADTPDAFAKNRRIELKLTEK
ncbi:MAG: peptidoglycan -binding protein [Hyphomicrobiales bacterium]|nr:peptidoglycan -binding protein [Hyphomicrobiales bacterium]MDE2016231.1 peptidoglycan -binding protein [Hyphomicrobiales bacterium]